MSVLPQKLSQVSATCASMRPEGAGVSPPRSEPARRRAKFCKRMLEYSRTPSTKLGLTILENVSWQSFSLNQITPASQDLAAFPFLRLSLEPAPGSTVEARGSVIEGRSTGWCVGRSFGAPPKHDGKRFGLYPRASQDIEAVELVRRSIEAAPSLTSAVHSKRDPYSSNVL